MQKGRKERGGDSVILNRGQKNKKKTHTPKKEYKDADGVDPTRTIRGRGGGWGRWGEKKVCWDLVDVKNGRSARHVHC